MMESLAENSPGQVEGSDAAQVVSLGRMLREARERAGLSVADVANQIKFAPRQIEALEADDLQHLPEMTFVRGFVRSYARILDMDVQPLLAALPQTDAPLMPLAPVSVEVPFPDAHSVNWQNLIWLGITLLLSVLVVAFAVWHYTTPVSQPEVKQVEIPISLPSKMEIIPASSAIEAGAPELPPVVTEAKPEAPVNRSPLHDAQPVMARNTEVLSQAPARAAADGKVEAQQSAQLIKPPTQQIKPLAQPIKPSIQPDAPLKVAELHFVFERESWVEVKDGDGKILSSQINHAGSELRLNGNEPFSLVISHAASVRLYHRGKQIDLSPFTRRSSEVARLTLE